MAPQKTICVESVAVVRSSTLALYDSYLYPTFIMMDLMEVNTLHWSSGPRDTSSFLLSSLSFEKHTKDVLLQGRWTMLNDNMTVISLMWKTSIVAAEGNDSQLWSLIHFVLHNFIRVLAERNMRDNIIMVQTVYAKVGSFNEEELEQWKVAVQNCVKENNWVDLLCR